MAPEVCTDEDAKKTSSTSKRLKGKVAVITGGARGIGAAAAKIYAENGAYVVIADILDNEGHTLANSIGGKYIHCDVSNESDVESAINLALTWKGKLDIIFNNAGISGQDGSITNLDMNKAKHLFSVNVNGIIHGIKHAAKAMIKAGNGGCIICMSSSAGIMGGLGSHPYSCSKEAIVGLMKSSACELGVHGIRVNCISPHGVPTEMLVSAHRRILGKADMEAEEVREIVKERGSLLRGKCASVEDVAEAALFLASDESGFITAHNLVIDGGYTSANANMSFIYQ
ncbi:short-chain dehydrogenase reductase ATA1 [Euphorbia lathyris]|uniref:short-chain dehydrogenase reductase ATA1 n=1 Tax=Euphorbia lathyris TaxID=212925 RepID=UPI0033139606